MGSGEFAVSGVDIMAATLITSIALSQVCLGKSSS